MAGPYMISIHTRGVKSGVPKTIMAYVAPSAAAGTYLPLDKNQVATTNSPQNVFVDEDCYIEDVICSAPSGIVEIISNGNKTGKFLDMSAHQATNAGRPKPMVPLGAGKEYKLQVALAFPA